jgi:KTSC domain-containing protein
MERQPLASRAIVSAGYDAASGTLELEFASGRIYQYDGVSQGTYDWLLRASSKGAYVSRMINDRYPYRDVTPPPEGMPRLEDALRRSLEPKR